MYDEQPAAINPIEMAAIMATENCSMHDCCQAAKCIRDLYDERNRLTAANTELLNENIALKNGYKVATAAIAGAMRIALLWRPGEAWRGMHEEEGMALESMYQSFAALTANGEGE